MALPAIVDTIDSVPEAFRGEYAEKDGKFYLNLEGGENLPFVTGLKTALAAERGLNKAAKDKVAAWERLGVSPEEIETRLEAERVKAEDALKKAGKFDEVLATHLGNAKKERDTAVSAAEKARESALNLARRAIVDTRVGGALTKSKATAEGLDLLTERLGKRVGLEFGDDGKETISIFEADGKTPMVGSGPGGLATFDDLVKDAIKNFPSLFEGAGGGSGTDPKGQRRDAGGKVLTRAEFNALSPADQRQKVTVEKYKIVD